MAETALHVTDIEQEKTIEPDGKGSLVDTWKIHFTTPSGTRTFVSVPATHYTAENVATLIHDEAGRVEAVHALEGTPLHRPAVRESN